MNIDRARAAGGRGRVWLAIAGALILGPIAACGTDTPSPGATTIDPSAPPSIVVFEVVQESDCGGTGQITLHWELGGGATGATIAIDGPGIFDTYDGQSRTETLPGACNGDTQTYLLTTIGGNGTAATATIVRPEAGSVPTIVSFTQVGPNCDANNEVTLQWELGGSATGATISIDGPGVYNSYSGTTATEKFPGACGAGNNQVFLLTTTGGSPAATATITVTASNPPSPSAPSGPTIVTFERIGPPCDSGIVTLHWVLSGGAEGAHIAIDGPGVYGSYDGTNVTETFPGACSGTGPANNQVFTITTFGGSGTPATRQLTVNDLPCDEPGEC